MIRLSAVQLTSTTEIEQNLTAIRAIINKIPKSKEHIVVLPECCLFFGGKDKQQLALAQQDQLNHFLITELTDIAKEFSITLVAGTIPVLSSDEQKFYNRCCIFSSSGQLITHYDKIHLFDVNVSDNTNAYRESDHTQAGHNTCVTDLGFGKLGLSVCYDLRFPELYRQLRQQGANIISVPSAFTRHTGKAHWQALLQARAIENQVFIIAAGQEGVHQNGRETWGHSMIISPWGDILAHHDIGEGFTSAEIDLCDVAQIRANMPVATHNQFNVCLKDTSIKEHK